MNSSSPIEKRHREGAAQFPPLVFAVFPLAIFFFVVGCFETPLSPIAPSWDVRINLPLVNRGYTVNDLIDKDTSLFRQDASGLLFYSKSLKFSGISVAENLKVDPVTESFVSQLGKFSAKYPASQVRRVSVGEMDPSLASQQGSEIVLQPFDFVLLDWSFLPVSEFEEVTLTSGQATVTLTNRLGIPIENISLTLRTQRGTIAQLGHTASLEPGDSTKRVIDLANQTFGNTFSFDLSGHYPGGQGPVRIDTSSAVVVRLDLSSDIKASRAIAKLPANSFSKSGSYTLDDSTRIETAVIRGGKLVITLNNTLSVSGRATFTISNLRQPNGLLSKHVVPFAAGESNIQTEVSLAGYSVESLDGRFHYSMIVETDDTGNNKVVIDSSMGVSATLTTSEISFESIRGRLKPRSVKVDVTEAIDLGDVNRNFSGSVRFSQARLFLTVKTAGQYPFDLNITLVATNRLTGQSASLSIPPDQRRVSYPQSIVSLTESNSEIVPFLNHFTEKLPDEFRVLGNAILNPTYNLGSVTAMDSVRLDLALEVPLRISLVSGIARDTVKLDIDADSRRDIEKANNGRVSFEIRNGLPVGLQVSLDFLDSERRVVLGLPKAQQPPLSITAAQVDAQGRVALPAFNILYVDLVDTDVKKLVQGEHLAFSINIGTASGGGIPVQLHSSDAVEVRSYATLGYRVNGR